MVVRRERRNDAGLMGGRGMNKLLLVGLIAALGACDRATVDERNASAEDVAKAVNAARADMKFEPGRWESNVTFVSMEAPGMPPEVSQAMQGSLGKEHSYATCLSKAEAEKPAADFFAKDAKDCTYDHFKLGGGKIDAKMRCGADGRSVVMTMNGAYDSDSYDMMMETAVDGGGTPVTMKMKVASNRVGDCRGDENATS